MIYFDVAPGDADAVPGYGNARAEFVFVGGAPPTTFTKRSSLLPMGASSVSLIQNIMSRMSRTYYITNVSKLRHPANRKVPKQIVRKWYPRLLLELRAIKPRRVLAMGIEAAETLCPGFQSMTEDHGTLFWNPELECYVVPTKTFRQVANNRKERDQLLRDLERMVTLPDPKPASITYWGRDGGDLGTYTVEKHARVWLDIETTGLLFGDTITRIGWTSSKTKSHVNIIVDPTVHEIELLRTKLADAVVIGHNLQFDLARLYFNGQKPWLMEVEDTLVRAHVMGERGEQDKTGSLSLKHLTSKYTDRPGPHAFGHAFSEGNALDYYLAEDVLSTRDLWQYQQKRLNGKPPYILQILNQLLPQMVAMQVYGVFVDRDLLREYEGMYAKRVQKSEKILRKYGDINWRASAQLSQLLRDKGVPLTEKTDGGAFSVAEGVLLKFRDDYEIVQAILDFREATKDHEFLVSYLDKTSDDDPYLRPRLILTSTETGRLSCRDPNLQQVPRVGPIKRVFRSRHKGGKIGLVDLAQAELRVVALLSADPKLIEALLSEDVHRSIASQVYQLPPEEVSSAQRKKSKGVTFGLLYGGSEQGLADRVGVPVAEVKEVMNAIFNTFTKLNQWIDRQHKLAAATGRSTTLFGRVRDLTALQAQEGQRSANRKATNTPVQSIASDIDLILMYVGISLMRGLKLKTRPVLGVHDSLLFDIYPGEEEQVASCMLEAFQALNETPLRTLSLWGKLPMAGEFIVADSWATCESTNEDYDPQLLFPLDSLESTTLVDTERAKELAKKSKEEKAG